MATISNDQVEALARQLLWEQIGRSAWFAGMSEEERAAAIEADVERWWHLKAAEASRILVGRIIQTEKEGGPEPSSTTQAHPAR